MSSPDFIDGVPRLRAQRRRAAAALLLVPAREVRAPRRAGRRERRQGRLRAARRRIARSRPCSTTRHRQVLPRRPRCALAPGARKDGKWGDDVEIRVPLGTGREGRRDPRGPRRAARGRAGLARRRGRTRRARERDVRNVDESGAAHGRAGRRGATSAGCGSSSRCSADVGLIGFPNAGKVDLDLAGQRRPAERSPAIRSPPCSPISAWSRAAARASSIADIPGLIPGAHRGAGLGHRFLRHVERTRCSCTCSIPSRVSRAVTRREPRARLRRAARGSWPTVLRGSREAPEVVVYLEGGSRP